MQKTCTICSKSFFIEEGDFEFYRKLSPVIASQIALLPLPTRCPQCRRQKRLAWRNDRNLYRRKCDYCGQSMVTAYSTEKPYTVYCQSCWWGDNWDALSFGKDYDLSKTFTEQFRELQLNVPRLSLMNREAENSEYCNYAGRNKNCYMVVNGSWDNEGCLHGVRFLHCTDCAECCFVSKAEQCYEVYWGRDLYDCAFLVDSFNCSECYLSANLRSCRNCILCFNLRNKDYHFLNKPVSKEKFAELRLQLGSYEKLSQLKEQFTNERMSHARPASVHIDCEESSGDYITACKNVHQTFLSSELEDGKYLYLADAGKDLFDCCCSGYDGCELFYETISAGMGGQRNILSSANWSCSDTAYCDTMMSCSHCFGCVGLKRSKYCILNKQYSKDDYEAFCLKIIEHMRVNQEWGEFFAESLTPFSYNESVAHEISPLAKDEAIAHGYSWREKQNTVYEKSSPPLPDFITDTCDDISQHVLSCNTCSKAYKIVRQELSFYRKMQIALPRNCPDCRHKARLALRNPIELWRRACMRCDRELFTSFSKERPETILCESCFLEDVY